MSSEPLFTPATNPPSILLTGATGNLGREVLKRLRLHEVKVRGLVRQPSELLSADESVVGEITDVPLLRRTLVGIDTIFLIWPLLDSGPAQPLVEALAEAGSRVVYLSSVTVADDTDRQSDPIAQVHADLERLLNDADVPLVVLRSDTLASNSRGWMPQLGRSDQVRGLRSAATAVVDERDVADAAVAVLLAGAPRSDSSVYQLTGPELLSRAEQLRQLGVALQRPLTFCPVEAELARAQMLTEGRPESLVAALIAASERRPASTLITDHVQHLTGRPAGSFADWIRDHLIEFS